VLATSQFSLHLEMNEDFLTIGSAARMAMGILKAGGTAVDAVEAAIKVLEDKEITSAGYGSNLSIDGVVECDATIVDHLGRSGACGATARMWTFLPSCSHTEGILILPNRDKKPNQSS
jgi:isoaspartyl peptidase/L-asparaginase-like protein (Ntn-hydrolase superfamily)